MPEEVACVSVIAQFPRAEEETRGNIQRERRTLQHLIGQLALETQTGAEVVFTFTVRPNYVPKELKSLHFGNRARDLEPEVTETLKIGYSSEIHTLEVRPWGTPDGIASAGSMDAKPMRVPLRFIQDIHLHTDPKPLTPYLEGRDWENLRQVPVSYARSE